MLRCLGLFVATLVVASNTAVTAFAAHASPQDEAAGLKRAVCVLRSELESHGADPYTIRSVCRLETASTELIEKLACKADPTAIVLALRDAELWLERTSAGVRADCRLRDNRHIVNAFELTASKLIGTQYSVECWLARAPRVPAGSLGGGHGSHSLYFGYSSTGGRSIPGAGHSGHGFGDAGYGSAGSGIGHPGYGHDPFRGGFSEPAPPAWARGLSTPPAPGFATRPSPAPALPAPEVSRSAPARGEIGRAILGALLTEISRR